MLIFVFCISSDNIYRLNDLADLAKAAIIIAIPSKAWSREEDELGKMEIVSGD